MQNATARGRKTDSDIFVVTVYAQANCEVNETRILGVFDSKKKAADYIFQVTGMHVNNYWAVTFIKPLEHDYEHGNWAKMVIDVFTLNEPNEGLHDWHDLQDAAEVFY